jgi:hypothetical protein
VQIISGQFNDCTNGIGTHTHTYAHTCPYLHMCTLMHACIHMLCTGTYTYAMYTETHMTCIQIYVLIHTVIPIYKNKSVYAHVPTHIHFIYAHRGASVHACIHIHVHTHTACPASGTYPLRSSWKLRKPAGKGCRPAFFSPQPAKAGAVKSHSHKELRPANTRVSLEGVFPQQCLQMKAS